jgi:glucokinase
MHYIGIDIGGTTIKAGRVDEFGKVSAVAKAITPAKDLDALLIAITGIVATLQADFGISAIGIGVPGLRNARTGIIQTAPHIPAIRGINLEQALQSKVKLPVVSENDANAGAYGEWSCGAGKGRNDVAYITLGTGLGCGLVLSGKLFRGTSGYAGEFGHTVVEPEGRPCACGAVGCLETRVSGKGIVQSAREAHFAEGTPFTAEDVYNAAIRGDKIAVNVFQETGRYLGIACSNLINLLNPEAIVIGGGVMASGDLLLGSAREEVTRRAFAPSAADCAILQSHLWPDAGIIGAAMLARDIC